MGIDYKCGTGHGVGHILNVHEGPNGFRWRVVAERNDSGRLEEGMITTDEPGVYLEGEYGIRTENELICVKAEKNEYGQFMQFENITYAPIDLDGIDPDEMTCREKKMLNAYHKTVWEKISPYLNDDEREWLKEYTREISMSKKIVLIDGHSILNRAFFGVPLLTNSEGLHTNAVYGFLNIMFKILDEEKPDYLTVAFDRSEPTFRHQMFDAYKGTRKPMVQELREQVPVMKEVLQAMGIKIVEMPGYEADDLLGTIAGMAEVQGMDVSIISGDRVCCNLLRKK